jgi:hypothetical protein
MQNDSGKQEILNSRSSAISGQDFAFASAQHSLPQDATKPSQQNQKFVLGSFDVMIPLSMDNSMLTYSH